MSIWEWGPHHCHKPRCLQALQGIYKPQLKEGDQPRAKGRAALSSTDCLHGASSRLGQGGSSSDIWTFKYIEFLMLATKQHAASCL